MAIEIEKYLAPIQNIEIKITSNNPYGEKESSSNNIASSIEGKVIGGNLNLNGKSSIRRQGSLSLIADDNNYKITDINNVIALNKEITITIVFNGNEYELGTFCITGASITHGVSGWTIAINIKDFMAKLNGECEGTVVNATDISPIYQDNGEINDKGEFIPTKTPVLFNTLIKTIITSPEFGNFKGNTVIAEIAEQVKQISHWTSDKYLKIETQIDNNNLAIIAFSLIDVPSDSNDNITYYKKGQSVAYQNIPFVYPGTLEAKAGESTASILEKIQKKLGNYEFFFDKQGTFHFQPIDNLLLKGNAPTNLTDAILYFEPLGNEDLSAKCKLILTQEEGSGLVNSYKNVPQYSNIKNDFVVWGKKNELAIRYHLLICKRPEFIENQEFNVSLYKDSYGVARIGTSLGGKQQNLGTKTIKIKNWQTKVYYDACCSESGSDFFYWKEIKEEWPKIWDLETNDWKAISNEKGYDLQSLEYYIDIIDPQDYEQKSETIFELFNSISIENIGRRSKTILDDNINCLFMNNILNYVLIEAGQGEVTKSKRPINDNYLQLPSEIMKYLSPSIVSNSAYDMLRSQLFQNISYCENITLQTIPIYELESNDIIWVEDPKTNIKGYYQVNTISLPLTHDGLMNITASKTLSMI